MIVYVHGMGDHSPAEKAQWDKALGISGSHSHWCHYADILKEDESINTFVAELHAEMSPRIQATEGFLPDSVNRVIMRYFTRIFIPQVFSYFYTSDRGEIIKRLADLLREVRSQMKSGDPLVVIGHSLGSIVAYETLCDHPGFNADLLITIGSPLGLETVQAELRKQYKILTRPPGTLYWENFADPLDVVCADNTVADEYKGDYIFDNTVANINRAATGYYGPHSGTGYLSTAVVRELVKTYEEDQS